MIYALILLTIGQGPLDSGSVLLYASKEACQKVRDTTFKGKATCVPAYMDPVEFDKLFKPSRKL
jgi:hypothetical protein